MDWKPIEGAPKYGPFLVYGTLKDGRYSKEPRAYICEDGVYADANGEYGFAVEEGSNYLEPSYGVATHWAPSPDPPMLTPP